MGGCFSSKPDYSPTANVVSPTGELRRYPLPVTASQVLLSQGLSPDSFFLCNSDRLYFDDVIPSMAPREELEPSQIYFLLSAAEQHRRLAAADMAALAVKASVALNAANPRRSRKSRISPVFVVDPVEDPKSDYLINADNDSTDLIKNRGKQAESSVSRSGSMRRLQRYSSRRAKLAVRSFRMRLATINEGSVLFN